jgi:hypothetical protein
MSRPKWGLSSHREKGFGNNPILVAVAGILVQAVVVAVVVKLQIAV